MIDPEFQPQLIAPGSFIADTATVCGQVTLGDQASIWFGAVVRGDTECVEIGERSNIQDLCVLHADPGFPCRIGRDVTIGHGAIVHGALVEDEALIGIRAAVLNGAVIGARSIVGAGAVVTEGTVIPSGKLVLGIPARVIRDLTDEDLAKNRRTAAHYVQAAAIYKNKNH